MLSSVDGPSVRVRLGAVLHAVRTPLAPLLLALLPALWLGARSAHAIPISHDHPTHLFKAWHFWTQLLPHGKWHGWSDYWAFGVPFDELVPPGGEVWVAVFRALTFAQLSWERTYAIAFGAFLVFHAFAVYVFAKRYFGVGCGVVAAWLTLLDPGGQLQGGWEWHAVWGVWPVSLAMSALLLGLERSERVLREGRPRDVALAGVWIFAALLTHQLSIVVLALSVPLLLLDHRLRAHGPPLERHLMALGGLVLGVLLAAFFLVPFFARTGETQDLGGIDTPLAEVARRFLELETFSNLWRPLHALAIAGAAVCVLRRAPGALFFSVSAALLVFLSSDALIRTFHLERALPTLAKLESNRMALVAKLFWFPLAGVALVALGQRLLSSAPTPSGRARLVWGVALAALLALVVPGLSYVYTTHVDKPIFGKADLSEWGDLEQFIAWSSELDARTPEHYRIAYNLRRDRRGYNEHIATLLPVHNGTPMYKVGNTPTQIFKKFPTTDEDSLLKALGVRYVLSSFPMQRRSLVLERRFGELSLYRFQGYRPEPFTLRGNGHAELVERSPERIRIRLSGTDAGSRLKLHVASYPRWRASSNGEELPITTVPVSGADYPVLMEVPARDGELLLEYVYRTPDWLGLAVSLGALPGFFGALALFRRSSWPAALGAWLRRHERRLWLAALSALLLVLFVIAYRTRSRERLLPQSSIFHHLDEGAMDLGGVECVQEAPLRFRCGERWLRAAAVQSEVWGLHLCMTTAPDAGPLTILTRQRMGEFVDATYEGPRRVSGTIEVAVAGKTVEKVSTRPGSDRQQFLAFDTRAWRGEEALLEITVDGGPLLCFDFRIRP